MDNKANDVNACAQMILVLGFEGAKIWAWIMESAWMGGGCQTDADLNFTH
jgi:hypothetical protein